MSTSPAQPRPGRPSTIRYRVAAELGAAISSGVYEPGQLLPPGRHLAEEYMTSRNTLAEAIDILAEQGMVTREHGKGVRVNDNPHKVRMREDYGVTREIEDWRGLPAAIRRSGGASYTHIDFSGEIMASAEVAERLRVPPGTAVHQRARVQGAEHGGRRTPIQLSTSYYAAGTAERIPEIREPATQGKMRIRRRIIAEYGAVRYESATNARSATAAERDRLDLPEMAVVFDTWRVCVDAESDLVLEATRNVVDARQVTIVY